MSENVSVEREGRIVTVRVDRGDGVNALSDGLMRELTEVARSFEDDAETSAVILTGTDSVFSLGFDLRDRSTSELLAAGLASQRMLQSRGPRLCDAWEGIEALTIVAIEGWCVGGGAALAVSCDLRVMASDAGLYVPEIERGMNMSWGSVPRIVELVGPARAKRVVARAEKIDAATAERWGLADVVAEPGHAVEEARRFAERAASLPPVQLRMCKAGIDAASKALNRTVSVLDRDQFLLAQRSDDFREGVSSFMEKRPPRYTGR
jgi:enoyl-CoA hydratase/carnithine racemase